MHRTFLFFGRKHETILQHIFTLHLNSAEFELDAFLGQKKRRNCGIMYFQENAIMSQSSKNQLHFRQRFCGYVKFKCCSSSSSLLLIISDPPSLLPLLSLPPQLLFFSSVRLSSLPPFLPPCSLTLSLPSSSLASLPSLPSQPPSLPPPP